MRFLETFVTAPFLDTAASYLSAFVFGGLIGAERQYRQRTAGLRTNVLVAMGAAAFTDLAARVGTIADAVRVEAYVVSGIGFLGAGVIMKEGLNIRGLNTAATLWCSAAVGACCGLDMVAEGGLLTVFVLAGNTLLRPLVATINRFPLEGAAIEAVHTVNLTAARADVGPVRDMLVERLAETGYPVAEVELVERGDDEVEVVATLTSSAVVTAELDRLIDGLERMPAVHHATWEAHVRG